MKCFRKAVHLSNLTFYERQVIESMLRNGAKVKSISFITGRDHSVISRELNRNSGDYFPYDARVAQEAANRRAKKTNVRKLIKHPILLKYTSDCLKRGWSPEQIAGRLKYHPLPELEGLTVSHEQIYEYIQNDGRDENGEFLYQFLRRKEPLRQKRYARKKRKATILGRISIHERPEEVAAKTTFGHWESDTMICRHRHGLSVQYERKSQLVRINKLANLKAETTSNAIGGHIESLPQNAFKTMTFDNGPENAKHAEIKEIFEVKTYFCDPFKAWQKGGVENINGLLRQYIPKGADMTKIDQNYLKEVQEKLNNRPRKSLGYLTPNEVLANVINVE